MFMKVRGEPVSVLRLEPPIGDDGASPAEIGVLGGSGGGTRGGGGPD
jgi:hypothetical protein